MTGAHYRMSLKCYARGHAIISPNLGEPWVYEDTGEPYDENNERPCKRCGEKPTPEGYDACTGYVKGARSVCCGHGVSEPIMVMKKRFGLEVVYNIYWAIRDRLFLLQMKIPFLRRFTHKIDLDNLDQYVKKEDK